jgi:predicted nucleic acid-binding protein
MAFKVLLDANILLEYSMGRRHFDDVRQLFVLIENGSLTAYTTTSIIQTCGYLLLREFGDKTTREILLNLLSLVTIIDCRHDVVIMALNSAMSDPEDAIQYYTALDHKVDYYISLDRKLIKDAIPSLPICTPAKFLSL